MRETRPVDRCWRREHGERRNRDTAGGPRVRLAFRVRAREDRDARDKRIVEQGALPVLIQLLLVPGLTSIGLGLEQTRQPDSFLAGTDGAELKAVLPEADADAVRQET